MSVKLLKSRHLYTLRNRRMKIYTLPLIISLFSLNIFAFSADVPNTQKELISFFDYVEIKNLSDKDAKKELEQYILEKCSALSFVWIGGDNEIFDVGDAFFEEAIAHAGKSKRPIIYKNIQQYGDEYINHWNEQELPDENPFTELMKDDMAVCLEIYEGRNYAKKYEGWRDSKLIED